MMMNNINMVNPKLKMDVILDIEGLDLNNKKGLESALSTMEDGLDSTLDEIRIMLKKYEKQFAERIAAMENLKSAVARNFVQKQISIDIDRVISSNLGVFDEYKRLVSNTGEDFYLFRKSIERTKQEAKKIMEETLEIFKEKAR